MLRDSKHCEGFAIYEEGSLKYSCDTNIESLSIKEKSFYNCDFYDMEEYSQCYKCPLDCKKNKSVVKKAKDNSKEEALRILDDVQKIYPIQPGVINVAKNSVERDLSQADKNAIEAVSFAQNLLNAAMSGRIISSSSVKRMKKIVERHSGK